MKRLMLATVVAVLIMGLASQAPADNLTVSLSNGVTTETCLDGAACDTNPLAGAITFTSLLGTLDASVGGTGSGAPALGPYDLDLTYNVTALSTAPGRTYTIQVSVNNLNGSGLGWAAQVGGTQNNGATTAFALFADAGNVLFGTATSICSAGPTSASPLALLCAGGPFSDPSFSLTERITIVTNSGITSATGDALAQVPEPGALLLVGSALLGIGLAARVGSLRRRFGRTAA